MPSDSVSRLLWGAYLFLWLGGVGSHLLTGGTSANMAWAAPVFLALAALIAIRSDWPRWRTVALAAGLGFAAEAIGLASGYPFGGYTYTPVLAPALLGVPVVVAGAWMILFVYVRQMQMALWASALAMTALDLVIDPLAASFLGFWKWQAVGPYYGVPLINFAGWFAVSLLIFALAPKHTALNRQAVWLGTSILLFFTALAAIHHYFFPAFLGAVLSGLGYARSMRSIASTMI